MSFLDTIRRAKDFLQEQGRVSLRALKLEFGLDDEESEALVAELVDIQQLATREGEALVWVGPAAAELPSAPRASVVAPGPEAPEAERRQLTVLFFDLVDSTRLSVALDPEDWREVVGGYQQAAAAVVQRFEGHIAQYLGDGILVYFGYPRAHEDDAERSVRAGLAVVRDLDALNERLEREHGLRVSLRVGIHTGPVVIGEVGTGARRETLALGETTNVAARLQQEAEPDTVVLSEDTMQLVQGIFLTEGLGPRQLKGIERPVEAYRALRPSGMRSRLMAGVDGLTPLVGREQETGILLDRWEQVQDGMGQVVLLSGEAGIGKSRLLRVLHDHLAKERHIWIECRCSSFTRDHAFFPIIDLLQQALAFAADDTLEERFGKLERALEDSGFDVGETVPLIAPLLSLPLPAGLAPASGTPERLKRLTRAALLEWLLRLGKLQPLVLLVEDLHWVDPSTLELLEMLVEQAPTAGLLAVLTHRPDFEPPWSAHAHVTPLMLSRLSRRRTAAMIEKVARGHELPERIVEEIASRADGIPLYVEELTKSVLESGLLQKDGDGVATSAQAAELVIPATLRDSLMARLDRLSPVKEVAQLCAAIGREFSFELLQRVGLLDEGTLRAGLARLVEAELLYQRGDPPDASYFFKHALIQETAYQSLLKARRRQFHCRIAETLVEGVAEAAESQPELVAYHFTQAGLPEQAIPYWQKAGQRAVERSANVEAVRHLRRGLEGLDLIPASAARDGQELGLRTLLGIALLATEGYASTEVLENFARARDVCESIADTPALFSVVDGLARFYLARSDREATTQLVEQRLRLAERSQDPSILLKAHTGAGLQAFYAGEHERARELLANAWDLYDPEQRSAHLSLFATEPGVAGLMPASWNEWYLGFPDRARDLLSTALDLAEQSGHPFSRAMGFVFASKLRLLCHEAEAAREHAEAAIQISREEAFPVWIGPAMMERGAALGMLGSVDEALAQLQDGLVTLRDTGTQLFLPYALCEYAATFLRADRVSEALTALDEAHKLVISNLDVYHEAEIHRLRGEALLRSAESAQAESCFGRALEICRQRRTRAIELRAATSLARLRQDQGKHGEARDLLQPVYDWFTEGFDTQDLEDAKALLEELS